MQRQDPGQGPAGVLPGGSSFSSPLQGGWDVFECTARKGKLTAIIQTFVRDPKSPPEIYTITIT